MNEPRNLMTKRTFGLLTTLSVLSIGIFTAALVLAYPNPSASNSDGRNLSDTQSIDKSRSIANTNSGTQGVATNTQSAQPNGPTTELEQSAAGTTSQSVANMTGQPISPTQAPQNSRQPAAAPTQQPNQQPSVVTIVRDTVDRVADFLPL